MAVITSTINKSGEDYNTITLWEAAKQGNLAGESRQEVAECYDDDGDLTDQPTIDGSTTNGSYYMHITAPVGDRHLGIAGGGFCLTKTFVASGGNLIYVNDQYVRISWLEIKPDFSGDCGGVYGVRFSTGQQINTVNYSRIDNCLVHPTNMTADDNYCVGISFHSHQYNEGQGPRAYNCIIYGFTSTNSNDSAGISVTCGSFRAAYASVYNCTIYGCDLGIVCREQAANNRRPWAKNVICYNNGTDYQAYGSTWQSVQEWNDFID